MTSQIDLQQAIALVKANQKAEAYPILLNLVLKETDNELAWLWLSTCIEKAGEKKYCMEQALRINPANDSVRQAVQKIGELSIPISFPEASAIDSPSLDMLMDISEPEPVPPPPITATQPVVPRVSGPASNNWWQKLPPNLTLSVSATRPGVREFPEISPRAFQHPLDVQARVALEKVPLLPQIAKKLSETFMERIYRIQQVSSNLRVGVGQYPSMYTQYVKLARILDVRKLPELYIETSPVINAYTMGQENYFIVVTTALIDHMTEDELLGVIGHELGHVKCDHMLYVNTANMLRIFGANILEQLIPGAGVFASIGAQLALLEWYRKAEFSCDRAALLTVQNPEVIANMLAKLGGYSKHVLNDTFDIEEVKRQAEDYEDIGTNSFLEKLLKLYALMDQTHPYPAVRVAEIDRWQSGGEYQRIMQGDYTHMSDDDYQSVPVVIQTPTALQCISCKNLCALDVAQCPQCGGKLDMAPVVCTSCGSPTRPEWVACPTCGSSLKGKPDSTLATVLDKGKQAGEWMRGKLPIGSKNLRK